VPLMIGTGITRSAAVEEFEISLKPESNPLMVGSAMCTGTQGLGHELALRKGVKPRKKSNTHAAKLDSMAERFPCVTNQF
jgi:hypothetical protein